MKVSGPACDTPALPRVNSSLPSGRNLNTWLPLTPASEPSLKGPLSTAQKFPSRSRQNPCDEENVTSNRLTMLPDESMCRIAGTDRGCSQAPPTPPGTIPIAAPDLMSPRCGQFSSMRYGLFIAFTAASSMGGGRSPRPRPCPPANATTPAPTLRAATPRISLTRHDCDMAALPTTSSALG